jgi:outer membrane protein assembly factor BamB
MTRHLIVLLLCLLWLTTIVAQEITFLQVSDIHVPHGNSLDFVRSLKNSGPVYLAPYQVTSGQPACVLATGDLTEFGGGYLPQYFAACGETGLVWYHMPGNHDNTWCSIRPDLRKLEQAGSYGFTRQGCHFIVLDSATPQDPRPSFGREQYEWLKKELAQVATTPPLFVFCHHPFGGTEFVSSYEQTRMLDLLRPYNVGALVAGHYHKPELRQYYGFPVIVGGQGYGELGGYNVFTVQNGQVWVAYRKMAEPEARTAIFYKDLRNRPTPVLLTLLPRKTEKNGERLLLELEYEITNARSDVKAALLTLDNNLPLPLSFSGKSGVCTLELPPLLRGSHFATVTMEFTNGDKAYQSFCFAAGGAKWECQLPGACKAGVAVTADSVYATSLDGCVYALDKKSGKLAWEFATGGEILGRAVCVGERIFTAASDGKVYALRLDGTPVWVRDLATPFYAPVVSDGKLLFASDRSGGVYALSLADGSVLWQRKDATYTIEAAPCLNSGSLFVCAWDCYLYHYRANDGSLMWKIKGVGSATKPAPAYYSPADCSPLVAGGKLYSADRAHLLGAWQLDSGTLLCQWEQVAAVSLAAGGEALYLRKTTGELAKMNLAGEILWTTAAVSDGVPTPATEFGGRVYVCTGGGKLSALNAQSGEIVWQYQVTAGLRVYGEVAADASGVYVADMDGKVTAIAGE